MRQPQFRLLGLAALSACSFAPISIPVQDATLPVANSQNLICYMPSTLQAKTPARFNGASFVASATYQTQGREAIELNFYGREGAPALPCVPQTYVDEPLSDAITLEPNQAKEVTLGGGVYGANLVRLVQDEEYYLGVKISGGSSFNLNDTVAITEGRVNVYF